MAHTLLMRLSAAMQSWGAHSRFSVRDSGLEPSKSGLIGLVCAALGIARDDDAQLQELAGLKMGVRVDREGVLKRDYHTAKNILKASGGIKETDVSNRYYLADGVFLVGLEGENLGLLERIQAGLKNPVWPLYLGRKAYVPGEAVWLPDGLIQDTGLEEALAGYPYLGRNPVPELLRVVLEDLNGPIVRPDQPLSFNKRLFAPRRLRVTFIQSPGLIITPVEAP